MLTRAIPVLLVASSRRAEAFFCEKLGFAMRSAMRPFGTDDPCYMGFQRDGAYIHVSSFPGDGAGGCAVMVQVNDVDALYREISPHGLRIDPTPVNQSWGNREMYVRDEDGNSIRFFCPIQE